LGWLQDDEDCFVDIETVDETPRGSFHIHLELSFIATNVETTLSVTKTVALNMGFREVPFGREDTRRFDASRVGDGAIPLGTRMLLAAASTYSEAPESPNASADETSCESTAEEEMKRPLKKRKAIRTTSPVGSLTATPSIPIPFALPPSHCDSEDSSVTTSPMQSPRDYDVAQREGSMDDELANKKKRKVGQMETTSSNPVPALRSHEMHFLSHLRDNLREVRCISVGW
jgi:hypothetical protein